MFLLWSVVLAGNPGRQQVIGVVGEVVTDEHVEQVRVAVQMGIGEYDELAVTDTGRQFARPHQMRVVVGQHGRSDQQRWFLGCRGQGEHFVGCGWVPADQPQHKGRVIEGVGGLARHIMRVPQDADAALTVG